MARPTTMGSIPPSLSLIFRPRTRLRRNEQFESAGSPPAAGVFPFRPDDPTLSGDSSPESAALSDGPVHDLCHVVQGRGAFAVFVDEVKDDVAQPHFFLRTQPIGAGVISIDFL